MELFFDTETSGFPKDSLEPDDPKQPWIMQLAGILSDEDKIYSEFNFLIKSEDRHCSAGAEKVHGISTKDCDEGGLLESTVALVFDHIANDANVLVCHNYNFDIKLIKYLYARCEIFELEQILNKSYFCTMIESTELCQLPSKRGGYKWPKLIELYKFLFNESFDGAHDALADVRATRRCYYELKRRGL